jgi:AcrR family transcriptional regulator
MVVAAPTRPPRRPVIVTRTQPRRVISERDVVRGACRFFLRHGTVEMDALALSLAISRATLYRVVHSRDRLLGDVLWELGEQLITRARQNTTATGVDGVLEITHRFCTMLLRSEPFRLFLRTEPKTATRVLFTPAGAVHTRAVAAQQDILLDAARRGGLALPGNPSHLAYLYVRIIESTLYAELLTGQQPDLPLAERTIRSLLTPTPV